MPLAFGEQLLMRSRLQHYSQVVAAYITMQTVSGLTVSITGLPRAHSDGVVYQDVKEPLAYYSKKCHVGMYVLSLFVIQLIQHKISRDQILQWKKLSRAEKIAKYKELTFEIVLFSVFSRE